MFERKSDKAFLFSGLAMLMLAFFCKWTELPTYCFWILLGIAIALKTLFLLSVFRTGFKPNKGFYFILTGVGMMVVSMFFKYFYPIASLGKILFYGAITLKIAGLIMMIMHKRNNVKHNHDG